MEKTKREYYNEIRNILEEKEETDLVAFVDHELELLTRKNSARSNKPTANQTANLALMNQIYESMIEGRKYRVSEINKFDFLSDLTINKVNALVRGLKLEGRVVKTEEKGVAYFTKAQERGLRPSSLPFDKIKIL